MELKKIKFYVTEIKSLEDGIIEAKVATQSKDRDGDILVISGVDIKQYKLNPVVLWGHNYNQPPIGKAIRIWKNGTDLMARIKFAISESAFASEVYRLYKGGYLNAFSIGFIVIDQDPETNQITKSEMIEFSAVPVPANAEALATVRMIKSISDKIENGEINIKDIKENDLKSPACRQDNESKKECVSRKIPELMKEGMEQDQAVAVANKLCSVSCENKSLQEKINLLEKSVSVLQKKVDDGAGAEKIHTVGKIASQSVEAINQQLKGMIWKKK